MRVKTVIKTHFVLLRLHTLKFWITWQLRLRLLDFNASFINDFHQISHGVMFRHDMNRWEYVVFKFYAWIIVLFRLDKNDVTIVFHHLMLLAGAFITTVKHMVLVFRVASLFRASCAYLWVRNHAKLCRSIRKVWRHIDLLTESFGWRILLLSGSSLLYSVDLRNWKAFIDKLVDDGVFFEAGTISHMSPGVLDPRW